MKNRHQCAHGLLYENFSIILIQTFTSSGIKPVVSEYLKPVVAGNIDDQLFTHKGKIIDRYELEGFDIKITIAEPNAAVLEGHVHVWAAVFFDTTVEISYRIIVPPGGKIGDTKFCHIRNPFTTDQLIVVAGIVQHVEHWVYNQEAERQEIDGALKTVEIRNIHIGKNGQWCPEAFTESGITLEEVQRRYRRLFDFASEKEFYYPDHHYIFVDIWETIGHQGEAVFDGQKEDEMIQHIEECHRAELVGLMSLYPEEWPFRMDSSFQDICGRNIAIDTDDLVLVNQNMSLVIGTYGKRGAEAPTNWEEHLKRRDRYHVSWPEYLVLLEILLAKKHTINYVLNKYIYNSHKAIEKDFCINDNVHTMIEQNAKLSVKLSDIMLRLDSVRYLRYMSHKHMFHLTACNLGIEEDERQLKETIKQVDKSLNNANNMLEIRQANSTKYILLFISIASLFAVILQGEKVPLLTKLSEELGRQTAVVLVLITSFGVAAGLMILVWMAVKYMMKMIRSDQKIYVFLFFLFVMAGIVVLQGDNVLLLSELSVKIGYSAVFVLSMFISCILAAGLVRVIRIALGYGKKMIKTRLNLKK